MFNIPKKILPLFSKAQFWQNCSEIVQQLQQRDSHLPPDSLHLSGAACQASQAAKRAR
jgi:hypothetical protein